MNYLDIVNKVLKKLREDTVASVEANDYSILIGEFVNDAKKLVENAWNWSTLTQSYTVAGDGTNTIYVLTNSPEDARMLYDECNRPLAFETTSGQEMQLMQVSIDTAIRRYTTDPTGFESSTQPTYFSFIPAGGTWTVKFEGIPSADRDYIFYLCSPQDELEDDGDLLTVPWRPVVNLATLYALDERGEEIGEPGSKAWIRYETSLADAVALDSLVNPHRAEFTVP
jgi:hypothetical protein